MLRELLRLIEATEGPITVSELSRQLNVAPGVIEGMLDHWVRKGRLAVSGGAAACCAAGGMSGGCGSCSGVAECPFVARMPRNFSVVQFDETVPN
jgi:hypothetical protein